MPDVGPNCARRLHLFLVVDMSKLFEIHTSNLELSWRAPSNSKASIPAGLGESRGYLKIETRNPLVRLQHVRRSGVPESVAGEAYLEDGPHIYEQVNYSIFVKSKSGQVVRLSHSDPTICSGISAEDGGTICHGSINFRSNVGFSRFTVLVDNKPEFDFEIEVFPTKLDYKSDYQQLIAETQNYIAGLVYEYLRSTFRLSIPKLETQTSRVEWLVLLKSLIADLERGAQFVARNPIRVLDRETQTVSVEKIRKLDRTTRRAIMRSMGAGELFDLDDIPVKERLPHVKSRFSLDTAEHRWISGQLATIRRKLTMLAEGEASYPSFFRTPSPEYNSSTDSSILKELQALERRVLRLERLEVFQEARGTPPPGFASLQLISSSGYRECYRACITLQLGLQIESGALELSLKEISLLYEYWCFLTVVALISKHTKCNIPVGQLVRVRQNGLHINLRKDHESVVEFETSTGRTVRVAYNKEFRGLTNQKPDIIVSLEGPGWPPLSLLLDAKYRVRFDTETLSLFGSPGPDSDSINVLHRYRDAILENRTKEEQSSPKRKVIQAAALFPYRDGENNFNQSRLWKSLDTIGIGGIPLVPTDKRYLDAWLKSVLETGEWALADRALSHVAVERAFDWRSAASQAVLIGVLRPEIAQQHLEWVLSQRCYYMPYLQKHPRQLTCKWVALYSPATLRRKSGAVTHVAEVIRTDVIPRDEIDTPWKPTRAGDEKQVVYYLSDLKPLANPIRNLDDTGKGTRFSSPRWSSKLGLDRAAILSELFLETEPEWRLYEGLRSIHADFTLEPLRVTPLNEDFTKSRVRFVVRKFKVQYCGPNGFALSDTDNASVNFLPNIEETLARLMCAEGSREE